MNVLANGYIKRGQQCRDACEGVKNLSPGLMLKLCSNLEAVLDRLDEVEWLIHPDVAAELKASRLLVQEVKRE